MLETCRAQSPMARDHVALLRKISTSQAGNRTKQLGVGCY